MTFIGRIVNESLMFGSVPLQLKEVVVTPLLKKKKRKKEPPPPLHPQKNKTKKLALTHSFKNYRPVSNLQFLSKLPKKAVQHQLRSLFSELELTLP